VRGNSKATLSWLFTMVSSTSALRSPKKSVAGTGARGEIRRKRFIHQDLHRFIPVRVDRDQGIVLSRLLLNGDPEPSIFIWSYTQYSPDRIPAW
jgi:hypothetical protein